MPNMACSVAHAWGCARSPLALYMLQTCLHYRVRRLIKQNQRETSNRLSGECHPLAGVVFHRRRRPVVNNDDGNTEGVVMCRAHQSELGSSERIDTRI